MSLSDRVLAGLVAATGLTRHVLWDFEAHRSALTVLPNTVASLPEDLRQLIEHTESSVGSVLADVSSLAVLLLSSDPPLLAALATMAIKTMTSTPVRILWRMNQFCLPCAGIADSPPGPAGD